MWRWFWPRERWRRLYHLSGVAQLASLGVVLALPSVFGVDGLVTVVLLFAVMLLGPGWWLYRQAVIEFIEQRPELRMRLDARGGGDSQPATVSHTGADNHLSSQQPTCRSTAVTSAASKP